MVIVSGATAASDAGGNCWAAALSTPGGAILGGAGVGVT